jgi:fatty acid amide hydrolase 2
MNDLLQTSGTHIATAIREGRLTSREAVEVHIAAIERVNPRINAVVATRFREARAEADLADERVRRGGSDELPPFHGVPCTIKECFALEGMPQSAGLLARRDYRASADATAVARLRAAGAIPLGVTNTSELCMWMESVNHVYGRTSNPYDHRHIAGGSSGGEGAIVGAGASPFGLGSDIGGSIRGPAFFNGVFGHKSTGGMVPGTGQHPMAEGAALRYLATGPLCRRAEDLMPLLRVLAGPDGQDEGCQEIELGDPAAVELAGRTVLYVPDNGRIRISEELRRSHEAAADHLRTVGMRVEEQRFAALRQQFDIWSAMLGSAQETTFGEMLGEGEAIPALRELLRGLVGRSPYTPMAALLALTDPLPKKLPRLTRALIDKGRALRDELLEALGPDGVMLYPPHSTPAPRHNVPLRQMLRLHAPFAYLSIMNVLEMPSTQVPLGLDSAGLPLGVQVISRHGNDHVTIAVALELERAFGGWTLPARLHRR